MSSVGFCLKSWWRVGALEFRGRSQHPWDTTTQKKHWKTSRKYVSGTDNLTLFNDNAPILILKPRSLCGLLTKKVTLFGIFHRFPLLLAMDVCVDCNGVAHGSWMRPRPKNPSQYNIYTNTQSLDRYQSPQHLDLSSHELVLFFGLIVHLVMDGSYI